MKQNPLVSVIVPNYNYAEYIGKTIESILAQTYQHIEVIVVDDGSGDGSLRVLERFGDKIKVVEQVNQGVSKARNNGVLHSQGTLVAFLDADDLWLPTKLERQIEKLQADEETGLVHCSMTFIDRGDSTCGESNEGMEGWVAEDFLRFERGVVIGAGSTSIVPRRVFDEVGGFDHRQTTAADWDFCYRVAAKYKVGFVRESLVLYRLHGSNMHGNIRAMEHDMLLGFEKAFASGAGSDRNQCYGNLHKTLAGSYFYAGQYTDFLRHAVKSVWRRPSGIGYFLGFPLRRFKRENQGGGQKAATPRS